jgi:hypothetical protein
MVIQKVTLGLSLNFSEDLMVILLGQRDQKSMCGFGALFIIFGKNCTYENL